MFLLIAPGKELPVQGACPIQEGFVKEFAGTNGRERDNHRNDHGIEPEFLRKAPGRYYSILTSNPRSSLII